jgi:hypothetical protein
MVYGSLWLEIMQATTSEQISIRLIGNSRQYMGRNGNATAGFLKTNKEHKRKT